MSWNEFFDKPVNYYDIPKTNGENKTDTVPCKTLEDEVKKLEDELQALKDELAGIDAAIAQAKKDTVGCGKAIKKKDDAAKKADNDYYSQQNRKKNWEQGGKTAPQNVQDDLKKAGDNRRAANEELAAQQKKCDDLAQKIKDLEYRKQVLPYKIKSLENEIEKSKAELEKCKQKAAEEKKKKVDAEKRKAAEEAAAATAAAQKDEARRKAIETNSYVSINIYELGLISSPDFWEERGVWYWLLAGLAMINVKGENVDAALKGILDQAEDAAGVPGSTDMLQALQAMYKVVGVMNDPCIGLGQSTTVQRLMKRTNKATGSLYTAEQALDKTDRMCEMMQLLKKLGAAAAGRK